MKKFNLSVMAASLVMMFALCGCYSDGYYQDKAVECAREHLLEELPQMPLMDQEYIKFNRPVILAEQISSNYSTGIAQICICWFVPGNPECYMVYGASSVRMMDWKPQRILRKTFKRNPEKAYLDIAKVAANDLVQNQFSLLAPASVNHIRYTLPGVWKCKFPLDLNPGTQIDAQTLARAEKLPRYVLAWQIQENDKVLYAVYGGTARNDRLEDFKMYFRGLYDQADFEANLLDKKPLKAPFGGASK